MAIPKPYTQPQYNRALAYLNNQEAILLPEAPWWAQEAIREHLTLEVMAGFADGILTAALTEPTPATLQGRKK